MSEENASGNNVVDSSCSNSKTPICKTPAKRRREHQRNYNPVWEEMYFFTYVENQCICLICHFNISTLKKNNLERHFKTVHKNFNEEFPENSALRNYRLVELKSALVFERAVVKRETNKVKTYSEASFRLSFLIARKKKPFEDGEMIKEALVEAAEALGSAFDNKDEIVGAFKDIPLSTQTVARRVEELSKNLNEQLKTDIQQCEFFSLHFDVFDETSETPKLIILIRLVFEDGTAKEELLKIILLKGKASGGDIFHLFKVYALENEINFQKLVSVTTDGSPAMMNSEFGFVTLCSKDPLFPHFLNYHCVHQQQALPSKIINFDHIASVLVKAASTIQASSNNMDLGSLKPLLDEIDFEGSSHVDSQSMSKGKFLQTFIDLLPEIRLFLESHGESPFELYNILWIKDLSFFADFSSKLSRLNQELQGKGKTVAQMIGCINAFKSKLDLWMQQMRNRNLQHFPNLKKIRLSGIDDSEFNIELYINHLAHTKEEFSKRFKDFSLLEPVVSFMFNPFLEIDVATISSKIGSLFKMDCVELELEIVSIQSDIQLKARADYEHFWTLADKEKYPLLKEASQRVHACFGSLHLSKSAQADIKVIKTKKRTRLTIEHLEDCLRIALTKYTPNYTSLADKMQCQVSH